jgi:hypothetical protein
LLSNFSPFLETFWKTSCRKLIEPV